MAANTPQQETIAIAAIIVATLAMIALTLGYLWTYHGAGIDSWAFTKMALVIAGVWAAIGATMGFFIVMIIRKNAGRG